MNKEDIKTLALFIPGCIVLLAIMIFMIIKSPYIGVTFSLLIGFILWACIESRKMEFKKGKKDR